MKHRIVIYRPAEWAADAEVVTAIESATGKDRVAVQELLAAGAVATLGELEEARAAELANLLAQHGVDLDREPVALEPTHSEFLSSEVPKWVKRGLLHRASVPLIFRNYQLEPPLEHATPDALPVARSKKPVGSGTFLRAVLTLGATLIGLGVILFIAANWQRIPVPVKIVGALTLTLVALHGGYRLRFESESYRRLGTALLWVAMFGIGGVVILIAQAYHVQAESYLLPLIWGALCVPLALLLRFVPALYAASALWFWANWLFGVASEESSWFYPALLLGLLVPSALVVKEKWLHVANIAALMVALLLAVGSESFWQGSVLVAGLVGLRVKLAKPIYDWLLVGAFFVWYFGLILDFEGSVSLIYVLPLAYFFYRAYRQRSNWLMAVTVVNTTLWLPVLLLQLIEQFGLEPPTKTGPLLWFFAAGVLWFGIGRWLRGASDWRILSDCLCFGGGALAGLMSYILSFRFYDEPGRFFDSILFLVPTVLAWLVGVGLAAPSIRRELAAEPRFVATVALLALATLSLVATLVTGRDLAVAVVLFNLTLFAGGVAMMVRGHRVQSLLWFNGGIALFVWMIGTRYLDTFVEYLPRSVFFVAGGLFLMTWAVLVDRQRKRRARSEEAPGA